MTPLRWSLPMDAGRFDGLARSLATAGSRRRTLGSLLAGAIGLLGLLDMRPEEAAAHNPLKACKKKSGRAKKRCIKKAKKHNAQHATEAPAPAPPPCASAADGFPCPDDGNPCTDDFCRAGTCIHPAKPDRTACGGGGQCCGGQCVADNECCTNAHCPFGKTCTSAGTCVCPTGKIDCGAGCQTGNCCVHTDCSPGNACCGGFCRCGPCCTNADCPDSGVCIEHPSSGCSSC